MRFRAWLFGIAVALGACSDNELSPPTIIIVDVGFYDGGIEADAGVSDPPDSGVVGKPQVDGTAQRPFTTGPWLISAARGTDFRQFPYLRGVLPFPDLGPDDLGYIWASRDLDEQGLLPDDLVSGVVYAANRLSNDVPVKLIARLDAIDLTIDRYTYPSDPYRHGEARLAMTLTPGTHELIARGSNQRGRQRIQLWQTDNEVWLNTNDVTRPDILRNETQTLYLGLPLLNLTGTDATDLQAEVLDSPYFEATARPIRPLPTDGMTQIGFELQVKGPIPEGVDTATVTLAVTGSSLEADYLVEYGLQVVDGDGAYRRTFVSAMDESIQTYAIRPPTETIAGRQYALALSLHGAGVRALGQARAYGPKDWAYVVAATNRRRFGFDWQDWGRLDALEVLDESLTHLPIDPLQVHLTGHSMGGHGTWHVGVMHPDLFAVIGPSAGWRSFASYGGEARRSGAFVQARAHNDTLNYRRNFVDKSVYIIHGENDNNVPVSQARTMFRELQGIPKELYYHEEPGVGHWWDGYPEPGAACVDWPPMFELMQQRQRTVNLLDFDFASPSPWVTSRRSFVEIRAAENPLQDVEISSSRNGNTLTVTSTNVASMVIDTETLRGAGIQTLIVDGQAADLSAATLSIGAAEKVPGQHGPIKEALFKPFCFVYPDDAPARSVLRETATSLMATWSIIGNGSACAVPFSARDTLGNANRVYVGIPSSQLTLPEGVSFTWAPDAIRLPSGTINDGLIQMVFPEGDRLAVALYGTAGAEWLLRLFNPFSSRTAYPDFATFVVRFDEPYLGPSGFFDKDWRYDAAFAP